MGSMGQLADPAAWLGMVSSGWSEMGQTAFWVALLKIMWINVLLSGDNAVVIAMASHNLPDRLRRRAIFFGSLGATGRMDASDQEHGGEEKCSGRTDQVRPLRKTSVRGVNPHDYPTTAVRTIQRQQSQERLSA